MRLIYSAYTSLVLLISCNENQKKEEVKPAAEIGKKKEEVKPIKGLAELQRYRNRQTDGKMHIYLLYTIGQAKRKNVLLSAVAGALIARRIGEHRQTRQGATVS